MSRTKNVQQEYEQFKKDIVEVVAPARVLLTLVSGSHMYNCADVESDVDFLAVYQWPTKDLVGLMKPPEVLTNKQPDWQAHEIGKFCRMLMKGNPSIVECLFTDALYDMKDAFRSLRWMRDEFLNQVTLEQYMGYANGQLARMKSHKSLHTASGRYNTKWAYHLIRLLLDAEAIVNENAPSVQKTGQDLVLLKNIRAGVYSPEEVENLFTEKMTYIEARAKPGRAVLKKAANYAKIDKWLKNLRMSRWVEEDIDLGENQGSRFWRPERSKCSYCRLWFKRWVGMSTSDIRLSRYLKLCAPCYNDLKRNLVG